VEVEDKERQEYLPPPGFERNTLFLDEMRHFVQVARGEAEPLCTLEDGIEALKVAGAALESAASGRVAVV
jgi:predicted dehydrogenase